MVASRIPRYRSHDRDRDAADYLSGRIHDEIASDGEG